MKRRLFSLLMVLCLMLSLVPAAFAAEEEPPTIEPDYSWYSATASSYIISDAADLVGLANIVNGTDGETAYNFSGKTITISADVNAAIDFGGAVLTPIGTYTKDFRGTFDGNGKTIKNASILCTGETLWAGFFGCVNGGTVKNPILDDIDVENKTAKSDANDAQQSVSGVAIGLIRNKGTADNITVLASCSVTGAFRTGGVVGSTRDAGTKVNNCTNNAPVIGSANYTGGIIGAAHNVLSQRYTVGTTVTGCTNKGTVSGTSEVGGIVGYGDRVSISGCENWGAIIGTGNYGTGGILGCSVYNPRRILYTPKNGAFIENCENHGSVTAPRAGGILGSYVIAPSQAQGSSVVYTTVTGCKNYGAVSSPNENGVCGAIYGAPISYANGDAVSYVDRIVVKINGCGVGGTVKGVSVPTEESALKTFISPSTCVELGTGNTPLEATA